MLLCKNIKIESCCLRSPLVILLALISGLEYQSLGKNVPECPLKWILLDLIVLLFFNPLLLLQHSLNDRCFMQSQPEMNTFYLVQFRFLCIFTQLNSGCCWPTKIAQEINLVNVNWNVVYETSHFIPLFALDASFCSEFRLNYFKYFWKCHGFFSSFPL